MELWFAIYKVIIHIQLWIHKVSLTTLEFVATSWSVFQNRIHFLLRFGVHLVPEPRFKQIKHEERE